MFARAAPIQRRVPVIQLIAVGICLVYAIHRVPGFSSKVNLLTIAVLSSFLALSVVGQTIVVMLGGIDLSVGNMIAFGAVLIPYYATDLHAPFVLVIAVGLAVSVVIGAISGAVSYYLGVHPLMVTLAIGTCVDGWVLVATNGQYAATTPNWLSRLSLPSGTTFGVGIPPIVTAWVLVTGISVFVLYRTRVGRRVYAVGVNRRAALLALARPQRIWVGAFALSAFSATVVGLLLAGFSGTGDPSVGDPYLFEGVAAVVVGGSAFGGGRGDYLRTAAGALFLVTLTTMLVSLNYDEADIQIISGVLIFLVVLIYSRERSARTRV